MKRKVVFGVLLSGSVLALLAAGFAWRKGSHSRLEDLSSVDELRQRFNEDRGSPRLVLLLSPT